LCHVIEIISATRLSEAEFWKKAALAASPKRLLPNPDSASKATMFGSELVCAVVAYSNHRPLPDIYNQRIAASEPDAVLVFVHDDVWIEDYYLAQRLVETLEKYDVVGIAGNRERVPKQTFWSSTGNASLSGSIAQGRFSLGQVTRFGPTPAECELLDGVLLAARRSVLQASGVLFDPRFDFHFYDMDFCRTARAKGLRLGTWPIAITHQSHGDWGERWATKRALYLEKWPD
jgi:GT2 family glycosyltransferase